MSDEPKYSEVKYPEDKSVNSEFWLKTKIKGVEFDLNQLIASNRNGRNDRSIAVLKFVLEDYKRALQELQNAKTRQAKQTSKAR